MSLKDNFPQDEQESVSEADAENRSPTADEVARARQRVMAKGFDWIDGTKVEDHYSCDLILTTALSGFITLDRLMKLEDECDVTVDAIDCHQFDTVRIHVSLSGN